MGKFNRWRLSRAFFAAFLWLAAGVRADAQSPAACADTVVRDSLIRHVYRTHPYTTKAYQLACDSVIAVCPNWDRVYQMKAMPFIKMGRGAEAYYWLDKAIALNPGEHLDYRAFLKCIFTKDYEGALKDFAEAEKLLPGGGLMDHSYSFYSALCYIGLGEFSTAANLLDSIATAQEKRLTNAHFNTYFYQGLAHYLAGRNTLAEKAFNRCFAIHPYHPDAHFYSGQMKKARGEKEKAKSHFRACISALKEGYNNSEDQEIYVRYPYEVGIRDAEEALAAQ